MMTLLWLPSNPEPRVATIAGIIRGGVLGNPLHVSIHKTVMKRWMTRTGLDPLLENPPGVHWWDVRLVVEAIMEDEKAQRLFSSDCDVLELEVERVTPWPEGWTPVTMPLSWSLSRELGYSHAELTMLVMSATIRGELPNLGLAASPAAGAWCAEQIKTMLADLGQKGEEDR